MACYRPVKPSTQSPLNYLRHEPERNSRNDEADMLPISDLKQRQVNNIQTERVTSSGCLSKYVLTLVWQRTALLEVHIVCKHGSNGTPGQINVPSHARRCATFPYPVHTCKYMYTEIHLDVAEAL